MKLNISIGREDDGDMIGSLAVNIRAENNSIHKVYVRDLKQAINEIKNFIIDNFEDIKLSKANLIVSNLSIYFCKPQYFDRFCHEITNNIIEGGYFVGNFLGKEDEWSLDSNRTFIDKEQLDIIFKDFEIVFFKEIKFNKETTKGKMKFWHIYQIIARKI